MPAPCKQAQHPAPLRHCYHSYGQPRRKPLLTPPAPPTHTRAQGHRLRGALGRFASFLTHRHTLSQHSRNVHRQSCYSSLCCCPEGAL